jgi:two-component system, NtrC family, sensor kinase
MLQGISAALNIFQRRLGRKLVLQLACAMVFIISGMTWLVYMENMAQQRSEALGKLREVADNRAREAGILFRIAQDGTYQLRDEYVRRLRAMGQYDPQQEFFRWFGKWPDGLTRVRPELDDHKRLPSVYLRPSIKIDADVRRRTVAAFELLREWGPIMTGRFYSAYIDLPGEGLIMYSPSVNWGAEANPDTNNFDYPPVQNAGPEKNPERKNNWTEVYFDDKALIYMVSTVTPIDLDGRWIAAASQDVSIQELLQRTNNSKLPGTYNLILSRDGRLVAHPKFEEKLKAAGGNLRIADLQDPLLSDIERISQNLPRGTQVVQDATGDYSLGIATIDGPDWLFVTVYPNQLIQSAAFASAQYVLVLGGTGFLMLLALTYAILHHGVRLPLKELQTATEEIAQGQRAIQVDTHRPDELGQLGRALVAMVEDLEKRESDLREANATLESRVTERTAALVQTNHELEAVIDHLEHAQRELINAEKLAALGALVAGVSHELNTPLGNALLIASTLKERLDELTRNKETNTLKKSTLDDYLADSTAATKVLLHSLQTAFDLVASFKQVAVDRSGSTRRSFKLDEVIHDVVSTLMFSISRTSHTLQLDIPTDIVMDSYPGAIGQVLTNFINNSLLHGFENRTGGVMRLKVIKTHGGHVQLHYSDNGCGIEEANLQRIFEPFFTTKLGQGGSGLGMHVVYNIVSSLLGGRVQVHSRVGEGTHFIVDIPQVVPQE